MDSLTTSQQCSNCQHYNHNTILGTWGRGLCTMGFGYVFPRFKCDQFEVWLTKLDNPKKSG